jgi:hypothetical protein
MALGLNAFDAGKSITLLEMDLARIKIITSRAI